MKNRLFRFLRLLVATYLGLCAIMFAFQRKMIYFPTDETYSARTDTFNLPVEEATVRVCMRKGSGPKALIYFGGNAEDVSYSLTPLAEAFPRHSIYAMNYRGYSGSTGTPSEASLSGDARKLFDTISSDHDEIIVMGRSLGSGVATRLASEVKISRLILVTPFDSLLNIACQQLPFLPVRMFLLDRFESWRYAPKITVPTLLLVAEKDELILRKNSDALRKSFNPELVKEIVIPNADHNSISDDPGYIRALRTVPAD